MTENKSQKEVLFRNRPQRRQVKMIEDGKKRLFLIPVQWMEWWDVLIGTSEYDKCKCTWVNHKLYHIICTGAALWEPIALLQRTSSQTWKGDWSSFFCRTVITISILMKIWKMIKHKILIVSAAVPFQIQPRNPEPWHVQHNQGLTRNSKEMTWWRNYSKWFTKNLGCPA